MSDPVEVPLERLSDEALRGIIDDFVLREGTDYGTDGTDGTRDGAGISLERKRQQVLDQLRAGEAFVTFDPPTSTCTILRR